MEDNPIIDALKAVFKIILIVAILAIIVWGILKIVNKGEPTPPDNKPPVEEPEEPSDEAVNVQVIIAEIDSTTTPTPSPNAFTKTGVIVADQEIEIFPQVNGLVKGINIKEGDTVKSGQSIASLGSSTQLDTALANYNSAVAQLNNAKRILATTAQSNYITQSTFQNQVRSAQSSIQGAMDTLNSTQITRYEQYRLEDSQRMGQNLQASQTTTTETRSAADEDIAEAIEKNTKFNVVQSRTLQELQGQTQDRQNYRQVQEAQNQLDQLYKSLQNTKVQGDLQALNVQSQILQIESQLNSAKVSLAAGTIQSPINGVVTRVNIRPGENVGPNTPLFTITNFDSIIAEANLSAEESIKLNQETISYIEVFGTKVPAQIISVGLTADPRTKTIPVKVVPTVQSEMPMIPNTFTRITFEPNPSDTQVNPNAFTLPIDIMSFRSDGIYVPVVKNNAVTYKKIVLALPVQSGLAGISSGLDNGDQVIISDLDLEEGTKVNITNS